ncbi:MAG: hypothetical protein AAGA23_15650 [Pseudomonadota bacterium]
MFRTFLLLLLAFAGSILIGTALTSVVSTQLNLASIQSMGLPVSFGVRAQTTWADLLGIFPMLAMVLTVSFLLGFAVAGLLVRLTSASPFVLYPLAGATSFVVFIFVVYWQLGGVPIETASRWGGRLILALCSAVAGWFFAYATTRWIQSPGEPA